MATNAQGHYERGERLPTSDYLEAVRKIGTDVFYVPTGEHSPVSADSLSDDEAVIIGHYRELDLRRQEISLSHHLGADQRVGCLSGISSTLAAWPGNASPACGVGRILFEEV